MRIKATITVDYEVDPERYSCAKEETKERDIRLIECHSLYRALFELLPWNFDDQVIDIKMEGL